jgi:hypothetical protein
MGSFSVENPKSATLIRLGIIIHLPCHAEKIGQHEPPQLTGAHSLASREIA